MIFIISIVLLKITIISSTYLNTNYYKPNLERNNVLNKGVWLKSISEGIPKSHVSDFIFKSTSMDVDLLDDDFYSFKTNVAEDSPFVSNYIERAKRSSDVHKKQRFGKSIEKCGGDKECFLNNLIEDKTLAESKLMTILKPASVFNDYPYEVAVLLRNAYSNDNIENIVKTIPSNVFNNTHVDIEILVDDRLTNNTSSDSKNNSVPKRSMNNALNQSEMVGDYNKIETKKVDRNIFNNDKVWQQDSAMPDSDADKVIPKIERHKIKYINERGLVKVIAMLAKAFKKIMKQHADIKKIHNKLYMIKEDVDNSVNILFTNLQEFDRQYAYLVNISENIKQVESKLNVKHEYIINKEKELAKSLIEFESQQNKFLVQQREFYNVQKLMLAQNEKINTKQNYIVKSQSEISHKQYNFARILKKAKEIYMVTKSMKLSDKDDTFQKVTTTTAPLTTESIKINLFSIPSATRRLQNQDNLILKEIDEQPVDDLIYKYYFNNTFIDNIMKNKILSGLASNNENNQAMRNVKKRDKIPDTVKSTILLPVNNSIDFDNVVENKPRERRWIRHSRKLRRKHRGKADEASTNAIDDEKKHNDKTSTPKNIDSGNIKHSVSPVVTDKIDTKRERVKSKPFLTMATNFCNEIGQNGNTQVLNWCIEKALRRLRNLDVKIPIMPFGSSWSARVHTTTIKPGTLTSAAKSTTTNLNWSPVKVSLVPNLNLPTDPSTSLPTTSAPFEVIETTSGFFPDNDELESNLKQYEIVKDKDGVFYYDSVHAGEGHGNSDDNDGLSDLILGMDSNSRIDVDPLTFDLQAKRQASVQKINENIRKMFHRY